MDEILLKYDKLIQVMASKYKAYASAEDLYQAGYVGLKEALLHYDEAKKSDLTSYICLYIKGEMLKEVSNNKEIRVGYDVYSFQRKIKEAKDELSQDFGREPSIEEVSYYLNESIEKVIAVDRLNKPVRWEDGR